MDRFFKEKKKKEKKREGFKEKMIFYIRIFFLLPAKK
jgi:hypothetical protein